MCAGIVIHHDAKRIAESAFGKVNLGARPGDRMADSGEDGRFSHLCQQGREVLSQPRISCMAGGVLIAFLEKLIERELRRFGVVERHAVRERHEAAQIRGSHTVRMTTHVDQLSIGAEGAAAQVDLIVAQRAANFVDVFHEVRRAVLGQVEFSLELVATGAGGGRIERSIEVAFEIVIGHPRRTIEPVTFAGATLVDQNHLMVVSVAGFHDQFRQLGRGFTWPASHVEDRTIFRVRVFCRDNDDLQREHPSFFGLAVLEDLVDTTAHFLFHARDVTRLQSYTR